MYLYLITSNTTFRAPFAHFIRRQGLWQHRPPSRQPGPAESLEQGFSNVVFSARTARKRAVREEGAGGGRSPPPAPSSPCERLRREQSKRAATFEKPCKP